MSRSLRFFLLSVCCAVGLVPTPAEAADWVLPASRDARIMRAHGTRSNGGYGRASLKVGNGESRGLVGFELPPGGLAVGQTATLRLRIDPRGHLSKRGTLIIANLITRCRGEGADWTEGRAIGDKFYCKRRCKRKHPAPGCPDSIEPGVTWRCPTDLDVLGNQSDCDVSWYGAEAFLRTRPELVADLHPEVGVDLEAPFGRYFDDDEEILLDVTAHVREAYACGDLSPSWVIRRADRRGGKMKFFSREAPTQLCECAADGYKRAVPLCGVDVAPKLLISTP